MIHPGGRHLRDRRVSWLYHLLGHPGLAPAAAVFVAVHALTTYSTDRRFLLAGGLIVAVSVIPLLPPYPAGFNVGALLAHRSG